MRYEHYDPRATVDNTKEWRNAVKKSLTVIDDEALRDVLFDSLTATKAYADNEDENMDGHVNEIEARLDGLENDLMIAYYDDTNIREYVERLEARIEKLEAFIK
ncbi:hypothetical protein [Weissella sp. MSCH1]|uniref:hypothetical protein n=1 Tax=Weissella sp. MSCH1 TaxID=3383343 RepID=UPI003896C26D